MRPGRARRCLLMTDQDEAAERYRRLADEFPEHFHNPDPEGIVILEGAQRAEAEAELACRLTAAGQPVSWARAGVYYEDNWIWLLRDVIRFPGAETGTYHRVIPKSGNDSAAILPRYRGELLLVRHFRHGIRMWSLEFPRGSANPLLKPDEIARIELREEMGVEATALHPLGWIHGQNHISMVRLHMFLAEVDGPGRTAEAEGITGIVAVSVERFEEMIKDGEVTDSTTLNLFCLARLRGLL